jgi:hypothetical protein
MEIIYEGPGSLFAEFGTAILEVSGTDGYTVNGVSRKGLVADEIVRLVVQFEPKGTHSQMDIPTYLVRWAANASTSIHVALRNGATEGSDCDAVDLSDEA